MIVGGGNAASKSQDPDNFESSWFFPKLASLTEGALASKFTNILHDLVGHIPGLTMDHTSHGIRIGATNEMASNQFVTIVHMIARGQWDASGISTFFTYLLSYMHVDVAAGKALDERLEGPAQPPHPQENQGLGGEGVRQREGARGVEQGGA